jgi:hypothetical protein
MHIRVKFFATLVCLTVSTSIWLPNLAAQSTVKLESKNGQHRLIRNGEPYFVKGVGGDSHLELLASVGGNSIRTWGIDKLDKILDDAHKLKLSVCVGLWLGHERHRFNYQNEASVLGQLNDCLEAVRKFKDHPAVLMWGVGNEMEGEGTNPAIWYAVNHIAREIKKIDPNHPTITVIAELGDHKVQNIERFCPDIDLIGVNSYGGISTMADRYRSARGTKPYIVTEHGVPGPWEVDKTEWGAPIELTSTAKATRYTDGYRMAVTKQPGLCLGAYSFLWGNKQETTATWFGMLLPDGSRLAAVDAMTEAWTGSPPKNRCPVIESISLNRAGKLKPNEVITAKVAASDPEKDRLKIEWVLRSDSATVGDGGDFQAEESSLEDFVKGNGSEAKVTIPANGGGYRLFAYVYDGQGGAAVANLPLLVDAPTNSDAVKAELPFILYGDDMKKSPFQPSGYMGNTNSIKMELDHTNQPHSGKTCLKVQYQASDNWGGVLWQSPADDWKGEKPGGLNLSGATELEFWVRGSEGGEVVDFVFGVLDGNQKYRDSAKGELKGTRLTTQWQKLRIPLEGRDLSRIKTGFGWSLAGQGKPITFFLDDIRYVKK